jgi:tRNA dimethylallyltransferase
MPATVSKSNTCIILTGPTASGKTDIAVSLARHFNTEIISCDSRQCFAELDIGVARPAHEILQAVPHHFIASHSIFEEVNAAVFEQYALDKARAIFKHNRYVVMTGGTGLYIRAFCEGLDAIPPVEASVRSAIIEQYEEKGIGWLKEELEKSDPHFAAQGEMKNPQRMMRALEVLRSTGRPLFSFRKKEKAVREFNIIQLALDLPMAELTERIRKRTAAMMHAGLEQEAHGLLPHRERNALQTVGYRELFRYFDGEISLQEAEMLIAGNTRQYAKRQLTWLRKDAMVNWCAAREEAVLEMAGRLIGEKDY